MDIASVAVSQNLKMLQATASTLVLKKAMGQDAQSIAAVLEMAQPQLAVPPGHLDIRV